MTLPRIGWAGHVAFNRKLQNAYNVVVKSSEEETIWNNSKSRWKIDNIKNVVLNWVCSYDLIVSGIEKARERSAVIAIVNLGLSYRAGDFQIAWPNVCPQQFLLNIN